MGWWDKVKDVTGDVAKETTKVVKKVVDTVDDVTNDTTDWFKANFDSDSYWRENARGYKCSWLKNLENNPIEQSVIIKKLRTQGFFSPTLNNQNWMQRINDNTNLTKIAIPGTHDSASYHSIQYISSGAGYAQTQILNFPKQLETGIRFFDLRGFAVDTHQRDCITAHGIVPQVDTIKGVFIQMLGFLAKNPSETIIVQLKGENKGNIFRPVVQNIIDDIGSHNFYKTYDMPELGKVRGKIVLITRFIGLGTFYIDYYDKSNSNYKIQDEYQSSLYNKQFVSRKFDKEDLSIGALNLNFLSVAPHIKNSLLAPLLSAALLNYSFNQYLKYRTYKHKSVILLDGVGDTKASLEIVNRIIRQNY